MDELLTDLQKEGRRKGKCSFIFKWVGEKLGCLTQDDYAQMSIQVGKYLREEGYEKCRDYLILPKQREDT